MAISDHHLIGIRKSLVETHPWLPVSVDKAVREAKAIALAEVRDVSPLDVTLPWVEAETARYHQVNGQGLLEVRNCRECGRDRSDHALLLRAARHCGEISRI
jgi:hypothetical protein